MSALGSRAVSGAAGAAGFGGAGRRHVLGGLAAGLGGVVAAACAAPEGAGGPGQSAKPVKISWAIWNGPTLLEAQTAGADLYRQKAPNVTLELVNFNDTPDLVTPWLANTGPHIAMNYGSQMIDTARQGMYTILDPYIKRDAKAIPVDDYIQFQLKAQQIQGMGQFGLPMYVAVYALLYNKTLFQKKGVVVPDDTWDWSKYAEASLKLADRDQSVYGALLFGTKFAGTKIFQNNGDVVNPSDDRKAAFAQPPGLEALQWIHDRMWKDRSWAFAGAIKDGGFKDRFAMLATGKLAMTEEMASWAIGDVVKGNPDQVNDWDIAPLPKGKQRTSRASIDAWTIWKGAPEQDAVWEFMKFLQTGDWLDIQTQKAGYQPPRVSLQDHYLDVLKKAIPQVANKNVAALTHPVKNKYARPDAIFRKDGDAWKIVGEAWDAAITRNEQGVPPAFSDAARRVDAAMG